MTYNDSDNDNDNSKHLHSIFWSSILLSKFNILMITLKIVEKAIYQS